MSRETKISIAILVFGFLAIGIYWFSGERDIYSIESERIVLPHSEADYFKNIPEIKEYVEEVDKAINKATFLALEDTELNNSAKRVQKMLLHNKAFLEDIVNEKGQVEHNDMMTVRPVIVSVLNYRSKELCKVVSCYEAIKYNFVTNTTTRAIVDVEGQKLLELQRFKGMQPDVSQRLRKVAQVIALNAPKIKAELGESPSIKAMSMANVRGSINNSPCENREHLCVAPTFSYHNKEEALWAIVDLTELKLAAAKWAGLGKTATPSCISERSFQNREVMEKYCQHNTMYNQDGWHLAYRITGSDGLEIVNATFNNSPVIKSAKIVDWHVAYRAKEGASALKDISETYVAGRQVEYVKDKGDAFYFGYNDAMGCPMFSTSVVLAFNIPQIQPLVKEGKTVGFYIVQDYRNPKWPMACNYRYENRFEFYKDGSFRVVGINIGRGCGENAIYRPIMRIDMDLGAETFSKYNGSWTKWLTEQSDFQKDAMVYAENKYLYKIENKKNGYYVEPNTGQFNDKSRGDNATLFVTKYKEKEGVQDLLTLGSCCKLSEDGVERYLEQQEGIENQDIVLWYVPRIQNDAREGYEYCWADTVLENGNLVVKEFPCIVGPKFVPFGKNR